MLPCCRPSAVWSPDDPAAYSYYVPSDTECEGRAVGPGVGIADACAAADESTEGRTPIRPGVDVAVSAGCHAEGASQTSDSLTPTLPEGEEVKSAGVGPL